MLRDGFAIRTNTGSVSRDSSEHNLSREILVIESPALNFEQSRPLMVEEKSFLLNVKFFVVFQKENTLSIR